MLLFSFIELLCVILFCCVCGLCCYIQWEDSPSTLNNMYWTPTAKGLVLCRHRPAAETQTPGSHKMMKMMKMMKFHHVGSASLKTSVLTSSFTTFHFRHKSVFVTLHFLFWLFILNKKEINWSRGRSFVELLEPINILNKQAEIMSGKTEESFSFSLSLLFLFYFLYFFLVGQTLKRNILYWF